MFCITAFILHSLISTDSIAVSSFYSCSAQASLVAGSVGKGLASSALVSSILIDCRVGGYTADPSFYSGERLMLGFDPFSRSRPSSLMIPD